MEWKEFEIEEVARLCGIQMKNDGMGAIAGYDMRVHTERDPLPALQKIGEGAFNGTVTRSGSAYTKDWTAGAGTLITYADVQ